MRWWQARDEASGSAPWYGRPRSLQLLLLALLALLFFNAVLSIGFKVTDFEWHSEKGRIFLFTRPYPDKVITYLLPRIMLDSVVATLDPILARAIVYPLAVLLLLWSARAWMRLVAAPDEPLWRRWLPLLSALFVLHPYLARDLNDCGPQIVVLGCLTGAFLALCRGRPLLAGLLVATSIAWKVTPLLLVGYLLLKRQWLAALATLVWLLAWLAAPALVLGWDATLGVYRAWLEQMGWMLSQPDPTVLGFEPPRHQNQSLRMLVARYTMSFGPEHPINRDGNIGGHWLYVTFGDLAPATAQRVYQAVLLTLGAVFAWRFRRPWSRLSAGERGREWSAVLLVMTLISPLVWLHHLAVALPAAVFVARDLLAGPRPARWRIGSVAFIAVVLLLLQRDVVQRELSLQVLSYKFDAIAMWLLVALVLLPPRVDGPRFARLPGAG
jgi:hypothetical protein